MKGSEPAHPPAETAESHGASRRFCWGVVACLLGGIVFLALPLQADCCSQPIDGIYFGTIGGREIVVELRRIPGGKHGEDDTDAEDGWIHAVTGSYFYRRQGVSIDLDGTILGDDILRMREHWGDASIGEWRLTVRRGKATGVFCRRDLSRASATAVRRLKISLKRVSRRLTPDLGWEDYEPHSGNKYYDLLLAFPLQHGPEIQVNQEIAYTMRTDPRFKVSAPRLTRFPNAGVMARINRDLDGEFTQDRLSAAAAACFPGPRFLNFVGFYNTTTAVTVFPPDILSVIVEAKWFSGGVHPGEGGYSVNYDLHTGQRFVLEDAFLTSSVSSPKAELAAVLAKLYLRHYVKPQVNRGTYVKPSGEVAPYDCEEVVRESMSRKDEPFSPLLYLSQRGLVIEPVLAHGDSACGPPVTVPYHELRPLVKRHSMLGLLVDVRMGGR